MDVLYASGAAAGGDQFTAVRMVGFEANAAFMLDTLLGSWSAFWDVFEMELMNMSAIQDAAGHFFYL